MRTRTAPARLRRIALLLALAVPALLIPVVAWPQTYEIVIQVYCQGPHGCGISIPADQAALEQRYRDNVHLLNVVFVPAGISFRIHEIRFTMEPLGSEQYSILVNDDQNPNAFDDLRREAQKDPSRLHLFLIDDNNLDTCFSSVPSFSPGPTVQDYEYFAVFCGSGQPAEKWAHEIGHHFCLPHPFTHADPKAPDAVGQGVRHHDGDGFADTAPDPGVLEASCGTCDERELDRVVSGPDSGQLRVGHEYCEVTHHPNTLDPASPVCVLGHHCGHCTAECFEVRSPDATHPQPWAEQIFSYAPNTEPIMTYYDQDDCFGPYLLIRDGEPRRFEALSPQSAARVRECISRVPQRIGYRDVCWDRSGDSDGDGICDRDDACPFAVDYGIADSDGDGLWDSCDPCIAVPTPTGDMDGDGIGDICDLDMDGDGCPNLCFGTALGIPCENHPDLRPAEPTRVIGTEVAPGCTPDHWDVEVSEGRDSDGDGILDCAESDDDNDGIPDDEDPTPIGDEALPNGVMHGRCVQLTWPTEWSNQWLTDFQLRLESLASPERFVTFGRFAVVGGRLYIAPNRDMTVVEAARALAGEALADGGCGVRLSVVARATGLEVRHIADFLPEWLDRSGVGAGRLLVLTESDQDPAPVLGGGDGTVSPARMERPLALRLASVWAPGLEPGMAPPDWDGDGVADDQDNCILVANAMQRDRDHDGIGDRCDADLDRDGALTESDLAQLRGCLETDLRQRKPWPVQRAAFDAVGSRPRGGAPARILHCRAADLNGDHRIDRLDLALAERLIGHPPGPSARRVTDTEVQAPSAPAGRTGARPAMVLIIVLVAAWAVALWRRRAGR